MHDEKTSRYAYHSNEDIYSRVSRDLILPSGVGLLDRIMIGGLHTGAFTHIYGRAAAGKTTLALQFVHSTLKLGYGSIYVNTEAASPVARLEQMAGEDYSEMDSEIKILTPRGFEEQGALIDDLELYVRKSIKIVVIDTLTRHYRLTMDDRKTNYRNHRELNRQAGVLKGLAANRDLAVVVVNQVTSRPEGKEEFEPVARNILSYWSDYTIRVGTGAKTAERNVRRLTPEGVPNEGRFRLSVEGFSVILPKEKE